MKDLNAVQSSVGTHIQSISQPNKYKNRWHFPNVVLYGYFPGAPDWSGGEMYFVRGDNRLIHIDEKTTPSETMTLIDFKACNPHILIYSRDESKVAFSYKSYVSSSAGGRWQTAESDSQAYQYNARIYVYAMPELELLHSEYMAGKRPYIDTGHKLQSFLADFGGTLPGVSGISYQ